MNPLRDVAFDPCLLDGQLDDVRLEALEYGADPTPKELELWRVAARAEIEQGEADYGWHFVQLWRIADARGRELFCALLMEDHGSVAEVLGPFRTRGEALAGLERRGEILERDEGWVE